MPRKTITTETYEEKQARWNAKRYEKHHLYHKIRYLKNKYPYIFTEHADELRIWLENHNLTPTMVFIEYIRSFIHNPRRRQIITTDGSPTLYILRELFNNKTDTELL